MSHTLKAFFMRAAKDVSRRLSPTPARILNGIARIGMFALSLSVLGTWSGTAAAAAKYARTTGNWGDATRWSSVSCAAAGATTFPTAGDDVTICNGISIAVEAGAARTADSVTIATGGTNTSLTFAAATSSLTVGTNLTINPPTANNRTNQVSVGTGTLTVDGNVTLTGGSANSRDALLTVSSGLITINGGLTINSTVATSSTVSITNAAGRINVTGAVGVANGDALYVDAGAFNVTNPAATLTTTHTLATGIAVTTRVTTGTLAIAGNAVVDSGTTGLKTMSLTTGVITVGGNLSVTAAAATADAGDATVSVTTGRITVTGNTTVTGGTTTGRDALLTVTGAPADAGNGINIGGDLNVNATVATSSTVSITVANGVINVAGNVNNQDTITVGAGIFSATGGAKTFTTTNTTGLAATTSVTSGTLAIAGNAVVDSGTNGLKRMTLTTGVITVGGNLGVTAVAATNDAGDATVSVTTGRITVTGNTTVTGGTTAGRDALLTVTGAGAVGQGINIGGTLNIVSTITGSSTVSTTNATSRLTVSGAVSNQDTLSIGVGIASVGALTTTNTTGLAATTSVTSGTLAIAGNAVVDSGTNGLKRMTLTTGVITVGGNLSVTAAAATADAGDATVSVITGRITVTGNTTVTGGTTAGRDALLTVTGAPAVAGNGINISGDLNVNATVATSSTVSITAVNGVINVAGNVSNQDTINVGAGVFSATGSAKTFTTTNTTGLAATTSVTSGTLAIAGNAVVDSGTDGLKRMTLTTGVITVGGNLSVTAAAAAVNTGDATVSVGTGRITVTGNVDLTGGTNANRDALLTVTGATALGNGINIGGTLNIASTVAGSSTVSLGTGSRVTLTGSGGINNGDTLTIGAGILTITNGGATLNNSNGAILATTTLSSGTLSIVGHLNNAAGETMTFGSGSVTVGGNFTSAGTLTPGTSTVTLNGTIAQTISGTNPVTFYNLAITNTANPNITLATNVVVTGTLSGTATLTSTCPTDYILSAPGPVALHSCVIPASFNAFEPPAAPTTCATLPVTTVSGLIKTKIAGATYPLCIIARNGTPAIQTLFNGVVKVEVVPSTDCLTTTTVYATMSPVTLTNGRASLTFSAVANSWPDVRVRISYPTSSPTVTTCSTDNYAIRPNSLSFTVTDGDWETAGTTRALNNVSTPGSTKHKAGRPFTITATAWNGAGTPAITTNYAGTPTASIASHIIPGSCLNGTACTLDGGTFEDGTGLDAGDGIVTSTTASYAEVGAFNMQLIDTTFAAIDAGDSTTAERYITSAAVGVGRFVPDHFSLSSGSRTPACTTGGAVLSYMGQPFTVAATLLAQNYAGGTTENYHFDSDPLLSGYAPATVAWQAENANSGSNLTARLVNVGAAWNKGSYAVNSSTATFNRVAATTPDGPYDSLQLGIALTDPDGPVLGGLDMDAGTNGDCTTTPPCTAKTVGTPISVRFGRLRLSNAFGSEQLSLSMPALLEYYAGSKWLTNTTDSCTTFATLAGPASDLTLTPSGTTTPRCGVLSGTCIASSGVACNSANPVTNGSLGLCLTAPTVKGFTDVPFGPIPAYLQFKAVASPTARASFGVYNQGGNSRRIIYRRETR